jgi:hypothetical protein
MNKRKRRRRKRERQRSLLLHSSRFIAALALVMFTIPELQTDAWIHTGPSNNRYCILLIKI